MWVLTASSICDIHLISQYMSANLAVHYPLTNQPRIITPIQKFLEKCNTFVCLLADYAKSLNFRLAVHAAAEFTLLLYQASRFSCVSFRSKYIKAIKIKGNLPSPEGIEIAFRDWGILELVYVVNCREIRVTGFTESGPMCQKRHSLSRATGNSSGTSAQRSLSSCIFLVLRDLC